MSIRPDQIYYAKSKLPNGRQPTVTEHLDLVSYYAAQYGALAQGATYPADFSALIEKGWSCSWFIFSGFALVVMVLFAFIFKYKHEPEAIK